MKYIIRILVHRCPARVLLVSYVGIQIITFNISKQVWIPEELGNISKSWITRHSILPWSIQIFHLGRYELQVRIVITSVWTVDGKEMTIWNNKNINIVRNKHPRFSCYFPYNSRLLLPFPHSPKQSAQSRSTPVSSLKIFHTSFKKYIKIIT